ncbi:MAG: DUF790 family protein [Acidobacteriota bacterium]|nr:MAG: DUF790 family protein [Acidobacteriota bacterium]
MLTRDLIRYRIDGDRISPALIDPHSTLYARATNDLHRIFDAHLGRTSEEIEEALENYTSSRADYLILRGLVSVLMSFTEFENRARDAPGLRDLVFQSSAATWPLDCKNDRQAILDQVSTGIGLTSNQLEDDLYGDLPERRRLIAYNAPDEPKLIIVRYNMELARALLYWAERIVVEVGDSYQDVFRYIKLCRLMHRISSQGTGYRIELDGPLSLIRGTRRYGIKMAVFLPALALCRKWRMEAVIKKRGMRLAYRLDDRSRLVSHFGRFPDFDSKLERDFAADFERASLKHDHHWRIARADAVIPVARNEVMIPDFTLSKLNDPPGHRVHLEIVGFWTPEYLNRKIEKVREAKLDNLILAVSKKLALSDDVAEELDVLWFKGRLPVQKVIERADLISQRNFEIPDG